MLGEEDTKSRFFMKLRIPALAALLLSSCALDVVQTRTAVGAAMERDEARQLVQAAFAGEVSGDYLIAEMAEGLRFGAYDRADPARNRIEVRVLSEDAGTRFEVMNRGTLENARTASRIAEALEAGDRSATAPSAGVR